MTDPIPDASTPTAVSTTPRADGLPTRDPEAAQSAISSADERPPLDVARRIVELAEDKKAADIVLLDLAGLTTLADCVRHLLRRIGAAARRDRRRDHRGDARREDPADRARGDRLVALGPASTSASVVVHVFTPPERDYYSLEKHWSEAKTVLRVQ